MPVLRGSLEDWQGRKHCSSHDVSHRPVGRSGTNALIEVAVHVGAFGTHTITGSLMLPKMRVLVAEGGRGDGQIFMSLGFSGSAN